MMEPVTGEPTLMQWLSKQLDADERSAQRANRGSIRQSIYGSLGCRADDILFFARHDPARVLAEVEAKRAMLALHERHVQRLPFADLLSPTGQRLYSEYAVTCSVCGWASSDPTSACETLRLLALPYADRAGYREEWKP